MTRNYKKAKRKRNEPNVTFWFHFGFRPGVYSLKNRVVYSDKYGLHLIYFFIIHP